MSTIIGGKQTLQESSLTARKASHDNNNNNDNLSHGNEGSDRNMSPTKVNLASSNFTHSKKGLSTTRTTCNNTLNGNENSNNKHAKDDKVDN
jgi:hypothetical protein